MTAVVPKQVRILRRTLVLKRKSSKRMRRTKVYAVRIVQLSCADTHCAALDVDGDGIFEVILRDEAGDLLLSPLSTTD